MTRDHAAELILQIKGSCGPQILAGVNGNLPEGWYACDLTAHRWDGDVGQRVAIFCDAKRKGRPFMIAAGAKLTVIAGTPEADLLGLADKLAEQLRAKIATIRGEDTGKVSIALAPGARMPERKTDGASGFDLYSWEDVELPPGVTVPIRIGIQLEMPRGMEAQIRGRSGMARASVFVHPATIDSDYRGELWVLAHNLGSATYRVTAGDRVAQMVFARVELPALVEVSSEQLTATARNSGGFGSTGR